MNAIQVIILRASALIFPLASAGASLAVGAPIWAAVAAWFLTAILISPLSVLSHKERWGETQEKNASIDAERVPGASLYLFGPFSRQKGPALLQPVALWEDDEIIPTAPYRAAGMPLGLQSARGLGRAARWPNLSLVEPLSQEANPPLFFDVEARRKAGDRVLHLLALPTPRDAEPAIVEAGDQEIEPLLAPDRATAA